MIAFIHQREFQMLSVCTRYNKYYSTLSIPHQLPTTDHRAHAHVVILHSFREYNDRYHLCWSHILVRCLPSETVKQASASRIHRCLLPLCLGSHMYSVCMRNTNVQLKDAKASHSLRLPLPLPLPLSLLLSLSLSLSLLIPHSSPHPLSSD